MKTNHNNFLNLAFNLAKINLGKTKSNPSVGCVVVKKDSVISSGYTSINGRPHAEFNALNKKINFAGSDLYVTMEPCTHYGLTPPCTDLIIKKGIKRVFFSFNDIDKRTAKQSKSKLKRIKIKVFKKKNNNFPDFYNSYFVFKNGALPFLDAKIATSKDYLTINKNKKWITNLLSRNRAHLIRSEYDVIMSTSKTINEDNSLLNCRLKGFDNSKPDLVIIDINLKLKKNLDIFKKNKRKIFIVTSILKGNKINYFKKKGIRIIPIKLLKQKKDFIKLFKILKNFGFNRILVESGLIFLNKLVENKFINNLYLFKSSEMLKKNGKNNTSSNILKTFKLSNKIKVNLDNDKLYKVKIK